MENESKFNWRDIFSFGKKEQTKTADADLNDTTGYTPIFTIGYDGEKNTGEVGPIRNYIINYELLRLRSWQSYLESEITQTVVNRYITWLIGKGLKLQSEPLEAVLGSEGIKINTQEFTSVVEPRFNSFRKSTSSDYAGMLNLNRIAKIAKKNALVGGDVLCVLRYIDGYLTIQLIDGSLVQSPIFGTESYPQQLPNGNKIINGIEINPRGQHVRYYVRDKKKGIIPIEARSESSGLVQAWLIYGMEYRLNNVRGLPMIAAVIETLKKMERYKEATIAGAEERAKIAYTIEHEKNSTGENPLIETMAKAYKVNAAEDIPEDIKGKKLQNSVSATLNKTAINMPIDAKLKMHESKQELIFKEFFTVNIELICAALQIPPDVAKSKYDSNFSASRAALKDWEHTLNVGREEFADDFYQKVYNFWLYTEVLNGKISAKGYLEASLKGNQMVLDAYQNARFVGPSVPHIDPWKEVKAEREKLGLGAAYIPLTTVESATENLNGSDSNENLKQYGDELQKAKDLKIIPEIVTPPGGGGALDPNALKNQLDSIQAMLEELQLVR